MFSVGYVVEHRLFDYRGVIFDVDACFEGSDEWYEQVARSRPPKDKPWYRVLVHSSDQETYVAERHLACAGGGLPIVHPRLDEFFDKKVGDHYVRTRDLN